MRARAQRSAPLAVPRDRVWTDVEPNGRVHARGADWKASFDADGLTFVPFLGSDAPRNFPVRFTPRATRRGGAEQKLDATRAARLEGDRVLIERGAFVEIHHLSPTGIEQTFELNALAGAGELVLDLALDTELAPRALQDGTILFENELGGVSYGRAEAIDARGERQPLVTRLAGGRIEIEIGGAFLERATLPVVVDPLIRTFTLDDSPLDVYWADVAYNRGTDRFDAVYSVPFSASDMDVYSVLLDGQGLLIPGLETWVDFTTLYWSQPTVAANELADNFLCAALVDEPPYEDQIRGRVRAADSTAQSPQTRLSGDQPGYRIDPMVGGDASQVGPSYFCVVYRSITGGSTGIHAQLVDVTGSPQGATIIVQTNWVVGGDFGPVISKTNGTEPIDTQTWNLAWCHGEGGQYTTYACQLSRTGAIVTPPFPLTVQATPDIYPSVSSPAPAPSGPREWMCVHWVLDGGDTDLLGHVLVGGDTRSLTNLSELEPAWAGENQAHSAVETVGDQYVVCHSESFQGDDVDWDVYAATYWSAGGSLGLTEGHQTLDSWPEFSSAPRIASKGAAGGDRQCGVVWLRFTASTDPNRSGTYGVYGALYEAPAGPAPRVLCSGDGSGAACPCGNEGATEAGCGNSAHASGATLRAVGSAHLDDDGLILRAGDMPANSVCMFVQAESPFAGGQPFGDGLFCLRGTLRKLAPPTSIGSMATYPGASDAPVSVAGAIPAGGGARYYQALYRDPANYCTGSSFNATNAVEVVWLP